MLFCHASGIHFQMFLHKVMYNSIRFPEEPMTDFAANRVPLSSQLRVLAALATLLLSLTAVGVQAQCPYSIGWQFNLSQPTAGARYTQGDRITIQWNTNGSNPVYYNVYMRLDWSTNNGTTWTTIANSIAGAYVNPYTYEWVTSVSLPPSTNYTVRISEDWPTYGCWNGGYEMSRPGISGTFTLLAACAKPVITTNLAATSACVNTSKTLSVVSDMTSGTYKWSKDGALLAITTTPSYTINPVTLASAGNYSVVLVQNCNTSLTTTSATSALAVNVPPVITKQPQTTLVICQSKRDTLKSGAVGLGKTFQWQRNGVNIAGATDSNLVLDNAQLPTEGTYTVVVTGTCSPPATSNNAVVTVTLKPVIVDEPTSLAICPGANGQLGVVASGVSLSYQWYRNDVPIASSGPTLPFTGYTTAQDGRYHVVVTSTVPNPSNCQVAVQSRIVTVTGFRPPTVVTQPVAVEGCVGKSVSLTSEIAGFGLSYSWTRNGATVPNSASNSLLLSNLTTSDAGDYVVTATGSACGLKVSTIPVRVNVVKTPTFSTQPVSKDVNVGQPLTLTLAASDASIIKWYKDGKLVAGQTGTTLTIPSASLSDAGYYNATVSNACSGISSAYARVTVTDPTSLLPRLTMSQESADLGQIPLGYNTTQTFSTLIQNTGTAVMTVSDVSITGTGFAIANATATPFTLAPGATSSVSIRATAENLSPMTSTLTVTTDAPVPTGMLNLTATPVLRYTAAADVSYGEVMQSTTKDSCIKIVNSSTTDITVEDATISGPNAGLYSVTSAIPMTITAGGTGEICVRFSPIAVGQNLTAQLNLTSSNGGNSTITLIGASTITGVDDLETRSGVTIYPNPARDEVSIRTANPASITIVNARGAAVATLSTTADNLVANWNTKSFNGTSVAAGTYSVRVTGAQGTVTVPLVVVR